jgi:hypothetical protein
MTQNCRLSEITVRASHSVRLDGLRRSRLALSGLILMASLAPPTAGVARGEPATKSQAEVETEVKDTDPNAGFHPEGVKGSGGFRDWLNDSNTQKNLCKQNGGTYTVFNGSPLCYKS